MIAEDTQRRQKMLYLFYRITKIIGRIGLVWPLKKPVEIKNDFFFSFLPKD